MIFSSFKNTHRQTRKRKKKKKEMKNLTLRISSQHIHDSISHQTPPSSCSIGSPPPSSCSIELPLIA
ncbi:hypothetical protein I3760_04G034800 [Carya illinoinensis]|nr:hypothetical protein I3760_04G034800 [Carya illinoinensis]